jgi:hypothetical protein
LFSLAPYDAKAIHLTSRGDKADTGSLNTWFVEPSLSLASFRLSYLACLCIFDFLASAFAVQVQFQTMNPASHFNAGKLGLSIERATLSCSDAQKISRSPRFFYVCCLRDLISSALGSLLALLMSDFRG